MSAPGRRAASEVPGRQGLRTPLTAAFVLGGETKAATLDTTADCFMIQPAADIFVAIGPGAERGGRSPDADSWRRGRDHPVREGRQGGVGAGLIFQRLLYQQGGTNPGAASFLPCQQTVNRALPAIPHPHPMD